MVMKKTVANSHFELLSGSYLELYGDRILQIETQEQYKNMSGASVFLVGVLPEDGESTDG